MRRQPQLLHPQDEVGVDRAGAAGEAAEAGHGGSSGRAAARVQTDGAGARQGVVLGRAAPVDRVSKV